MATKKVSWKKQFTTVTRFSKTVALILFIALPIIAFLWGRMYQQLQDLELVEYSQTQLQPPVTHSPFLQKNTVR